MFSFPTSSNAIVFPSNDRKSTLQFDTVLQGWFHHSYAHDPHHPGHSAFLSAWMIFASKNFLRCGERRVHGFLFVTNRLLINP